MQKYFVNNNSDELIIFFCGWSMDEKPFRVSEPKDKDILYLFDYSNLTFDFDFTKYKRNILVAFSYGVFISALAKDCLPALDLKVAVNGTLKPIDREFGIPEKIFDLTLNSMSSVAIEKFYKRMFDNNLDHEYFAEHLPERDIENCTKELKKIKEYAHLNPFIDFDFDKIIISKNDKIIPSENQLNYWKHKNAKMIVSGHFPFYKFKSFNEIVSL